MELLIRNRLFLYCGIALHLYSRQLDKMRKAYLLNRDSVGLKLFRLLFLLGLMSRGHQSGRLLRLVGGWPMSVGEAQWSAGPRRLTWWRPGVVKVVSGVAGMLQDILTVHDLRWRAPPWPPADDISPPISRSLYIIMTDYRPYTSHSGNVIKPDSFHVSGRSLIFYLM